MSEAKGTILRVDLSSGKKKLLPCESGCRESMESLSGVVRNLTHRGLKLGWLTIVDGHVGIWAALGESHPQRGTARLEPQDRNVPGVLPKQLRNEALEYL